MMFAHGRWLDWEIDDKLGSRTPPPSNWGDEQSVLIMQKFKDIADVSHPDNLANGTLELNTVYQSGDIAMQVQYHEFAASCEDEKTSKAAGALHLFGVPTCTTRALYSATTATTAVTYRQQPPGLYLDIYI